MVFLFFVWGLLTVLASKLALSTCPAVGGRELKANNCLGQAVALCLNRPQRLKGLLLERRHLVPLRYRFPRNRHVLLYTMRVHVPTLQGAWRCQWMQQSRLLHFVITFGLSTWLHCQDGRFYTTVVPCLSKSWSHVQLCSKRKQQVPSSSVGKQKQSPC